MSRKGKPMKPHRIKAVMLRHTYEARRNMDRVIDMVYWPVLDIIVWGFFTIYLGRGNHLQPGMISFMLGAIILWGLFFGFQRDMAVGFLDELWSRNLVNLFSTPLSVAEYMTGLIAVNVAKAMVGMSCAALIAWLFYAFDIFPRLPAFLPFMLNLVLFALALGVIITGLIFRYTTKIQGLAWSFAGLLMPLSCVLYPLKSLPKYLRPIAWMLPTTHSFEGMRQVLAGGGFSSRDFEWGLALNVGYFVFAIVFFRWIFESARSRGLLVKLE
jgi:ABC-2 type transport system permease protein